MKNEHACGKEGGNRHYRSLEKSRDSLGERGGSCDSTTVKSGKASAVPAEVKGPTRFDHNFSANLRIRLIN